MINSQQFKTAALIIMEAKLISKTELAHKCELSLPSFSRMMSKDSDLRLDVCNSIMQALQVDWHILEEVAEFHRLREQDFLQYPWRVVPIVRKWLHDPELLCKRLWEL